MSDPVKGEPSFGMQRQLAVYLSGAQGRLPEQPVLIERLRSHVQKTLDPKAWGYLEGGAGSEQTIRANTEAFRRWQIVPRMLRGVSHPDAGIELLGHALRFPVLLAPIGVQSIL
ncbi:MAG: alpha-hydroxy-acid oxidizing protein, partial [Acidobacteriota bacterium]|nr:alpha-hydroxy-acid oxidizing protein [Acidobacteriota bacterium]